MSGRISDGYACSFMDEDAAVEGLTVLVGREGALALLLFCRNFLIEAKYS